VAVIVALLVTDPRKLMVPALTMTLASLVKATDTLPPWPPLAAKTPSFTRLLVLS